MPQKGRIVVGSSCREALSDAAGILSEDLMEMFGMEYAVAEGKAEKGDIYLALSDKDKEYGVESYRMKIGSNVEITAADAKGVLGHTHFASDALQPAGRIAERGGVGLSLIRTARLYARCGKKVLSDGLFGAVCENNVVL